MWSGLGYYRRAKSLHEGAKMVVNELNEVSHLVNMERDNQFITHTKL